MDGQADLLQPVVVRHDGGAANCHGHDGGGSEGFGGGGESCAPIVEQTGVYTFMGEIWELRCRAGDGRTEPSFSFFSQY